MRIAVVCPYAWDRAGGVQTHVRGLARALRGRGHEVVVIAPRSRRDTGEEDGLVFVGRTLGIPINGSVAPLSFGPAGAAGIRRALAKSKPDVVHLHEPLIPSLSLLALAASDVPVVGTFHASADGSLGYRLARPVLERWARRLSARTAVSDAARELIARYFPGEYHLTPNGIDVARFAEASPADLGPGPTVLFLGRIERRKGLEVLIQAVTRLRDLNPTVVIAGNGPEEKRCRRLAAELKVQVRWLGRVDEHEVARVFRGCDVYCAPGLGGESFGIVLLEAMAAGAPVVCSDLPGFRAVAGAAATLVPPRDSGRLADELRRVLTDADARGRMKTQSKRVASMFDWSRLVGGVEHVYESALEQGSG